jgi:hypothetical protein
MVALMTIQVLALALTVMSRIENVGLAVEE